MTLSDAVFFTNIQEDGQRFHATVVKKIQDMENELEQGKERIKFLCKLNNGEREELLTYEQIVDFLNRDAENQVL